MVHVTELNMLPDSVMKLYVLSYRMPQTGDTSINFVDDQHYLVKSWRKIEKLNEAYLIEVR